MEISIASDHAGFNLKSAIIDHLKSKNIQLKDFGTDSDKSMDYPDVAHPLADSIRAHNLGILICGSANGVAMTANKHKKVRAAICWEVELAKLAREHNNANVLCLPARFISEDLALQIVDTFLVTEFEGGRHEKRVNKVAIHH